MARIFFSKRGQTNHNAKLTDSQVKLIRDLYDVWDYLAIKPATRELAKKLGVHVTVVSNVAHFRAWKSPGPPTWVHNIVARYTPHLERISRRDYKRTVRGSSIVRTTRRKNVLGKMPPPQYDPRNRIRKPRPAKVRQPKPVKVKPVKIPRVRKEKPVAQPADIPQPFTLPHYRVCYMPLARVERRVHEWASQRTKIILEGGIDISRLPWINVVRVDARLRTVKYSNGFRDSAYL